ncbi:MAG: protein-disulfide reductase DsbD [Candidatus Marinimicrobia bacterium]|nr:protein-disulfide reductase DsbD [Candidatus Neomarinimicrobiota bacterium]
MKRVITVLLMSGLLLAAEAPIVRFSVPEKTLEMTAGGSRECVAEINIREGWHINSAETPDEYSVPTEITLEEGSGFEIRNIDYPEGKTLSTAWGGKMSLYEGDIRIPVTLQAGSGVQSGEHALRLTLSYQGCNDASCLAPETLGIRLPVMVKDAEAAGVPPDEKAVQNGAENKYPQEAMPERSAAEQHEAADSGGPFQDKSMFLVLLIVFVMGLALNLTPCVYPLIPVTMGFFIAQKDARSPVLLALMYVAGLAVTYSVIGTLAAFGGSMMGSLLAHPATLIFFSLLMLALSLSMFGLYEFKLPDSLTRASGGSRSGAAGALIMGLTMGVVAAPCVGPFIVSLLSFVAREGNPVTGFFTFFVLALGLGLPYIFLGIFSTKISALPRSGEWLNGIRKFFGLALIGMAIYFVLPLIPGRFGEFLLPLYMILAAVYYAVIDRSGLSVAWFTRLKILLSMIVLAAGILMLKPAPQEGAELSWERFSREGYREALSEATPLVIDFYADWCNPCRELEHITFADPRVREMLEDYNRIKVDLTVASASTDSLKEAFGIIGVPTIVFYDSAGREQRKLRLYGFEKPAAFLRRLEQLEP